MRLNHTLNILLSSLLLIGLFSCEESVGPSIDEPATYNFLRDSQSSVSFSGQTTRIQMAEELSSAMTDFNSSTESSLLEMFRNETEAGGDADPFANADLNASTKSIKSKVAASADYFSANTATAAAIKADFESWIKNQIAEVFPNENTLAEAGIAGQIADGSSTRYINEKGLEYNQALAKSLIGALMVDQALNNYLSPAVLDAGDNRTNNDNGVVEEGKTYTTMEHKWDEAYGYLYGTSASASEPNATIGNDDSFLNKYIGRVEDDADFAGIADEIYQAFKLGRAAIVAGEYDIRDDQAEIIQTKISQIMGIRAVYYLQQGKTLLNQSSPDRGGAFHDLSEGFGFVYGLQFTRVANTGAPYFSKTEVDAFLADMMDDGENGFWDLKPETLDQISEAIAARYDFTVLEAGSTD